MSGMAGHMKLPGLGISNFIFHFHGCVAELDDAAGNGNHLIIDCRCFVRGTDGQKGDLEVFLFHVGISKSLGAQKFRSRRLKISNVVCVMHDLHLVCIKVLDSDLIFKRLHCTSPLLLFSAIKIHHITQPCNLRADNQAVALPEM